MLSNNKKSVETDGEQYGETVLYVNRVAKVVKGGRRFSFSAIVVVGNQNGKVGVGLGKANEVPEAIKKAAKCAKKNIINVPIKEAGRTIPHEMIGKFGAGHVILKPAKEGTGVIASATVRGILDSAGYQNVRTKTLRSRNIHNVVKATLAALKQLRSSEQIAADRGKTVEEVI